MDIAYITSQVNGEALEEALKESLGVDYIGLSTMLINPEIVFRVTAYNQAVADYPRLVADIQNNRMERAKRIAAGEKIAEPEPSIPPAPADEFAEQVNTAIKVGVEMLAEGQTFVVVHVDKRASDAKLRAKTILAAHDPTVKSQAQIERETYQARLAQVLNTTIDPNKPPTQKEMAEFLATLIEDLKRRQ